MKNKVIITIFILFLLCLTPSLSINALDNVEISQNALFLDVNRNQEFELSEFDSTYLLVILFCDEWELVVRNLEILYPCLNTSEMEVVSLFVDHSFDEWDVNGFLEAKNSFVSINWYYGFVNNSYMLELFNVYNTNDPFPAIFVYNTSNWDKLYYETELSYETLFTALNELNLNLTEYPDSWWNFQDGYQYFKINPNNLEKVPKGINGFSVFILIGVIITIYLRKRVL